MFGNITFISITILILFLIVAFFGYRKGVFEQNSFLYNFIYTFSQKGKYFVLVFCIFFACIAFLEPRGFGYENVKTVSGNIVFVLDSTKSMNALDYRDRENAVIYSKLDMAKKFIIDYMYKYNDNNYGIVAFAGTPRVISPLSNDFENIKTLVMSINEKTIAVNGTSIDTALERAANMFAPDDKSKTIVLLTDGGDEEQNFSGINDILAQKGVSLVTIGLGSEKGSLIPENMNIFGPTQYKRYNGKNVITYINDEVLKKLEGEYFRLLQFEDEEKIISKLDKLQNDMTGNYLLKQKKNLSRIFIALSFALFYFYFTIDVFGKKKRINF